LPALLLLVCLALPVHAQDVSRDWLTLAASLQPGTRIELDLADGTHVDGTVLGHQGDVFVFSPRTRLPVPPWRIAYSEIRSLDVKTAGDGLKPGTKVLIGIAAGAGVALLLGVIAVASLAD
jgi:hypothetical protein